MKRKTLTTTILNRHGCKVYQSEEEYARRKDRRWHLTDAQVEYLCATGDLLEPMAAWVACQALVVIDAGTMFCYRET